MLTLASVLASVLRAGGGAPNGKVLSTLAWVLASNLEARARVESKSALRPQSEVHERLARHALAEALWSA